ncbi:protrudin-like isoform X2 [Ptychodera flava]|uniref:protrudin-like isoform X2 n=1 Tax=Ptychodera flava TaxID=63121 RepID=UPI00396A310F
MANEPTPAATAGTSETDGVQPTSENGDPTYKPIEKCDVGLLISNVRSLESLSEPVVQILKTMAYILSWDFPALTVLSWVLCNLLCVTTTKGHLLCTALVFITTLAGLGFVARRTRSKSREKGRMEPSMAVRLLTTTPQDEQYQEDWELKEALSQYREFILDFRRAVILTCKTLHSVYDVLLWRSLFVSAVFYIGCFSTVLSLYFLPLYWTTTAAVNILFLSNGKLFKILTSKGTRIKRSFSLRRMSVADQKADLEVKAEVPTLKINSIATDSDNEKASEDVQFNNFDPEEDASDPDLTKELDPSKGSSKTSMVDRFRELRQRHKKLNSGTCNNCNVTFTTLLKRRRYCRHCGNHFCSKCCNKKVPRSVFGATAPAAHTEKELVCNTCYSALLGDEIPMAR